MTERSEESTRRSRQDRKLSRRERRRKMRYRPVLEQLEDRVTPAAFQVTSLLDDGSDGTLRWAVQQANLNPNGFNSDFSEAPDVIDIQVTGTIQLNGDLDLITDSVTITGQGSDQTSISGRDLYGVFVIQVGNEVSISDLKIVDGRIDYGGGINNYGNLTLNDVVIESCEAIWHGGGIWNASTGTITANNVMFLNNFADAGGGGAIYNRGVISLDLCYFEGNFTDGEAGGIWNDFEGGGSFSTLEVNRTTFKTNAGAILNAGQDNAWSQLTVNDSLFVDNSGYAIYNMGGSQNMNEAGGLITNTTFSANSGNAIHQDADSTYLTLVNCTITGNSVGIYNENDSGNPVVLLATIVAGNGTDLSQPAPNGEPFGFYSLGYNIIGNVNTSSFVSIGGSTGLDLIGDENNIIDPGLAALADNGGPVETHALLAGSQAINRGSFMSPDYDARGLVREAVRDAGAYEYHQFVVTNTNSSGAGSLAQAILDANAHANVEGTPDIIVFQLTPGSVINLTSALPIITDAVQIFGSGSDGTPQIIIDGGGTVSDGIVIGDGTGGTATDNSVIRGLVLRNFFGASLSLNNTHDVIVAGNYFGTDITGNSKVGIAAVYHIQISGGFGHRIGSMNDADSNVIGGAIQGIYINDSQDNQILGNLIGTGRDGSSNIGNSIGIIVIASQATLIGNQAGFAAFAFTTGSYSLDGRNIISNNQNGIQILQGSSENFIYGNYIGLDAFADAAAVQSTVGVAIADSSSNGIGSSFDSVLGNRFYGNQQHVVITGSGSFNNEVANNDFGVSLGEAYGFVANTSIGVRIEAGAQENTVHYNYFYNTVTAGISVVGATGTANLLKDNHFLWFGRSVTGMTIDLNGDGILNANDVGDADSGPNSMLNYPVVTEAHTLGYEFDYDTLVRVDLTAFAPGSWNSVSIRFYAVADYSQEGNNHYYTPIPGSFSFTQEDYERGYVDINIGHGEIVWEGEGTDNYPWVYVGESVAAIAIDAAGSTSEMSPPVVVESVLSVYSTSNDGEGSLRNAIIAANSDPDHSYIYFNLYSESFTIDLTEPLPEITSKVTIVGFSQDNLRIRFEGTGGNVLVLGEGSDGSSITGVEIFGASAEDDIIGAGILIKSSNNFIAYNSIHNNSKGIVVVGAVTGNTFSQNRIYSNFDVSTSRSIGIDINNDGVTPPDTAGVENTPSLILFGDNDLGGGIVGAANTNYRIEIFYSPSGHEARNYLGSVEVTTDSKGVAKFREVDLVGRVAIGEVVTATATNLTTGSTSELSRPLVNTNIKMSGVENPPGVVKKDGIDEQNAYLVQVGSTFQLQVNLSDPGQVHSWTIRWGDGTTTTSSQYTGYVPGETDTLLVSHNYKAADAPNGFSIIFEAETESGEIAYGTMAGLEYVQVNWIQSTIDDASSKPVNPPENPGDPPVVEVVRIPGTTGGVDQVNATAFREFGATGVMEVFVAIYNETLDVQAESADRTVIVSYDLRVTYPYDSPTDGKDTVFVGFKIPDGAIDPRIYIRLDDGTLVEPVGDPEYNTAVFVDPRIGFFKNGRQGNVFYIAFSSNSDPTLTQLNGTVFTITDLSTAPPITVINNIVAQISAPNLTPSQTASNYDAADDLLSTQSSGQRTNLQAGSAAPSSGIIADSGGAGNPPPDNPELPEKMLEQVMRVTSQVGGAVLGVIQNLTGWMSTNLIGPRTVQAPGDVPTDKNDYEIEIPKGALEKEVDPIQSIARQNLGQVQVRDTGAVTEAFSQYADETPLPDDAPPILGDEAISNEKVSLAPFFVGMPLMIAALHGPRQSSRRKPSKVK